MTLTFSRRYANLLFLGVLLSVTGCAGAPWEKRFWVPPAASGVASIEDGSTYPITRAAGGKDVPWPSLSDVPERPAPPATPEQLTQKQKELEADHAAAQTNGKAAASVSSEKITIPDPPKAPPELEETPAETPQDTAGETQ